MSDLEITFKRIQPADAPQAYCCMTEVPTPWGESLCVCRDWIAQNLGRYVEGYHAQMADGQVVGHLYYAPSESALFAYEVEPGAAVLYCDWVQRRYQRQGIRRRLLDTFVSDMRKSQRKGILVECTDLEGQMHYRHYQACGFQIVHEAGRSKLMYLALTQPSTSVRPLKSNVLPRHGVPVEILILSGYLCPFEVSTQMLLLEVAREFGERVVLRQESLTPETLLRYGVASGVFINGRHKLTGATTEEAIRQAIAEEM